MTYKKLLSTAAGALMAVATMALSLPAHAAAVDLTMTLANHPDGGSAPPQYGFRLDGLLLGASSTQSNLTFDLEDGDVKLHYTENADGSSSVMTISGTARGGVDTGGGHSESAMWTFYVTYAETNIDDIQAFETPGGSNKWEMFILGTASMTGSVQITDCDACGSLLELGQGINLAMGGTKDYSASSAELDDFEATSPLSAAQAANVNFFYELIGDGDYDHRLSAPDTHCPDVTEPACQRDNVSAGWVNVASTFGNNIGIAKGSFARDWIMTGDGGPTTTVVTGVSEPGALGLMMLGVAGISLLRRRKADHQTRD